MWKKYIRMCVVWFFVHRDTADRKGTNSLLLRSSPFFVLV